VLIQSGISLISIGTERMLVEFGKANMLYKARQQPEKVKMALGYCNTGTVQGLGFKVYGFKAGDRVVSNGSHAGATYFL